MPTTTHHGLRSIKAPPPNTRVQRTRSSPSVHRSPLTRHPLDAKVGMKRLLSSGLLGIVALTAARSHAGVPSSASLPTGFGSLSPAITLRTERGQHVLEYCPDSTCERFVAPASTSRRALADFAYLYLYRVSEYFYLTSFKKAEAQPRAKSLLAQYSKPCPQPEEMAAWPCLLRLLARENHIRIFSTRQDEGQVAVTPIELEEALGRVGAK